ncbi:MAG: tripartite tricarboxylate transporter TctB family protein [Bryobacteraceae bacterium]
MNADRVSGALFLAVAAVLAAGARGFPAGVGPLPGPAFFPLVIAAVMAALAVVLLARGQAGEAASGGSGRLQATVIGAIAVYLALWGVGGFAPRTVVFLTALLWMFGEPVKRAVVAAAAMTAFVVAAFQYGLRVTLE